VGEVFELRDRDRIAAHLRRDVGLHLYEIGDLDDFFWPRTTWLALGDPASGAIDALLLVYRSADVPVLLAFAEGDARDPMLALLAAASSRLPDRLYAHLSPGLGAPLAARYDLEAHGRHLKMLWTDRARVAGVDTSGIIAVDRESEAEVCAFFRASYPGNWFDPRMLETGQYFCAREGSAIVAVGGVHVHSPTQRVAAIGNVATAPEHRGRGLATRLAARLCASLAEVVDHVGLNVEHGNAAAIACYAKLGFREVARYDEVMLTART
jgi:ribosomal protein S18 acetylase RimI-like enzyme